MPDLEYFTFIEHEGATYRVPVFSQSPGDYPARNPLHTDYLDVFSEAGQTITLNGVPIDLSSKVASELVSASLSLTALQDVFSSNRNLTEIDNERNELIRSINLIRDANFFEAGQEKDEAIGTAKSLVIAGAIVTVGVLAAPFTLGSSTAIAAVTAGGIVYSSTALLATANAVDELRAAGELFAAIEQALFGLELSLEGLESDISTFKADASLAAAQVTDTGISEAFKSEVTTTSEIADLLNSSLVVQAKTEAISKIFDGFAGALDMNPKSVRDAHTAQEVREIFPDSDVLESIEEAIAELELAATIAAATPASTLLSLLGSVTNYIQAAQTGEVTENVNEWIVKKSTKASADVLAAFSAEHLEDLLNDYDLMSQEKTLGISSYLQSLNLPDNDDDGSDSFYSATSITDHDDDGQIDVAANIDAKNESDFYRIELEPYSIYRFISGPNAASDVEPDMRLLDGESGRSIQFGSETVLGNTLNNTFQTTDAREVVVEISANEVTAYELFITRRDGPKPDKWDPALDDYRNWIDDTRLPLGDVDFRSDSAVISGTLNHRADPDFFEIPADAGWSYDITMTSSDDDAVTFDLLDGGGRRLVFGV